MALITDEFHEQKLKKYNINIKTKYIVGNQILERNTDNSKNDDIKNGIINSKEYYINNILKHKETEFDSRIEYTFIFKEEENKEETCPNCGMKAKLKDFKEGCPYCRTKYNIDYTDKDLGSKYHYDRVVRSNKYRIITGIIDFLVSLIISFIFIKTTSRTFNNIDVIKIFIYGLVLALILYYAFYILDAYVILGPIKKYKDKQNKKQIEFWQRTKLDKKKFFNNLNYEVRKYYYSKENIIDYDIIDYIEFKEFYKNNLLYVKVTSLVRVVYFINGKLKSKIIKDNYILKRHNNGTLNFKNGEYIIDCPNCGATISITKGECSYCHTKIKYLQEWVLEN